MSRLLLPLALAAVFFLPAVPAEADFIVEPPHYEWVNPKVPPWDAQISGCDFSKFLDIFRLVLVTRPSPIRGEYQSLEILQNLFFIFRFRVKNCPIVEVLRDLSEGPKSDRANELTVVFHKKMEKARRIIQGEDDIFLSFRVILQVEISAGKYPDLEAQRAKKEPLSFSGVLQWRTRPIFPENPEQITDVYFILTPMEGLINGSLDPPIDGCC